MSHSYKLFGISAEENEKILAYAERFYFEIERLGHLNEKYYTKYLNSYLVNLSRLSKSKKAKLFFMLQLGRVIQADIEYWQRKNSSEEKQKEGR